MYTINKDPGKYEGNRSEQIARVLNNICNDSGHSDEISFYDIIVDWYGLIKGRKYYFICHEDNDGFFTYDIYSISEGRSLWSGLVNEYEEHYV